MMESEPSFKRLKTDSESVNIKNEFESKDTFNYVDLKENEESEKLTVKDNSLQSTSLNSDLVEPLEPSVVIKENELSCTSFLKEDSYSVNFENSCDISNEDHLLKSTLLSDIPDTEDEQNKLVTSFKKDKAINVTLPNESTCLNSKYKGNKKKKKKIDKPSYEAPNYFVAVQISNPEIHKAVLNVQEKMLSSNEKLSGSLIDVATLHITLFVLHISNEDQLHIACSALDHCCAKLSKNLSENPLCLKFSGISHFSNKTIFAQLEEDNDYKRFLSAVEIIQKQFLDMGVTLTDDRSFTPHLTIAKLSKLYNKMEKNQIRKIEPKIYASEVNRYFGEQFVSGLQLLSMTERKDEKRYYYSARETLFDFVPTESTDHSECCFSNQPKNPKGRSKSVSYGFNKDSPSSDSSNTSSTFDFFRWVLHRPKLKETVGNFNDMKGTISNSFHLLTFSKRHMTYILSRPNCYNFPPSFSRKYRLSYYPQGAGIKCLTLLSSVARCFF